MQLTYNCEGNGEVHLDVLKVICGNTEGKSLCDLCCGFASQTRQLGFTEKHFVDKVYRDLAEESKNFWHNDIAYHIGNIAGRKHYDVVIMLDAIEHFKKPIAYAYLDCMIGMAEKQIIFTPLGSYLIETTETEDPDSHKSGWWANEFEDMGWSTIVFTNFHKLLNIGAFFAWRSPNQEQEFERIKNELNQKEWTKFS